MNQRNKMSVDAISSLVNNINISNKESEKKGVDALSINDFFQLIAAQLENQSMYDTVDNTQFLSQLSQFTSLSQMKEMTSAINSNYAASLLGRPVCVNSTDQFGNKKTVTGTVEQITFSGGIPYLYVNGDFFALGDLTDIGILSENANEEAAEQGAGNGEEIIEPTETSDTSQDAATAV
ncbi:MAG: flagellar hook capping FlgD N-terminal domain-containing protein [Oscillospiraceae bacterium]|nr:flagellar hook capping FlgD N-terminal domain-containing protein [Oscillospiraceae bacterium]